MVRFTKTCELRVTLQILKQKVVVSVLSNISLLNIFLIKVLPEILHLICQSVFGDYKH